MKILKERGEYLAERAVRYRNASVVLFAVLALLILYFSFSQNLCLICPVALVFIFGYSNIFLHYNYGRNYRRGLEGEELLTKTLSDLSDDYYLINDIRLPGIYGNIDHILLGPNGIFVIETKNYRGKIRGDGDTWIRHYGVGFNGRDYKFRSPCRQVKRNAVKTRQLIESSKILKNNVWVEGIVVFTNQDVELQLANPATPVLKINELCDYIKNKKSNVRFSPRELNSIGKVIMKQAYKK